MSEKPRFAPQGEIYPRMGPYGLESGPQITLYANKSAQSQVAFDKLAEGDIHFRVIPSPNLKQPIVEFGKTRKARGVENIGRFVDAFHAFERTFMERTLVMQPDFLKDADPKMAQYFKDQQKQDTERARRVMLQVYG